MREIKQGHERYFAFGDVAYPRDVKTNLIVYGKQNEYYTLESLLLLWENREMQHTAYVKDASGKGIQCVTRPDRRELLAYLKGEREQPPQNVDVLAPIPAPIPLSRLNDQNEPEPKKARYDGEESRLVAANPEPTHGFGNRSFATAMDLDVPETVTDVIDRELKNKERVWKNRTSVMEAASKDFTPILSILHSLKSVIPIAHCLSMLLIHYSIWSLVDLLQERFNKDQTAGFKIETGLTFQGDDVIPPRTSLKAISSAGAKPMAADSTTPLTKSSVAAADINGRPQKRQSKTPIIIIPAAGTSLITMYNGPAWQFKGWRWGGNPTDIFANVAAFHLMFDDQRLDSNVAKWSVNILKLSRNKRHLDRAILARFWETLDHHIIKNKPHLRY
uniref:Uncharacterized protein n=1 Tax=Parascaris equorum TaxID=6256 RepID=A0A914RXU5_PAREQ